MFGKIPDEMKHYVQWIVWRLEDVGAEKPSKVPYNPRTGELASVTDSSTWATFDAAVAASCMYSGIGFVLTQNDPFFCIDLDHTSDQGELDRQIKVFEAFDTWAERSQSGSGGHLWGKGSIPSGRRRASIEVYSSGRYMAMTGDALNDKPIAERQELLTQLWEQLGGEEAKTIYNGDAPERYGDAEIIGKASAAANRDKFCALCNGEWKNYYPSQSEADFAFIDMLAFYTQNKTQLVRLFRNSALGQRKKASRDDYVSNMIVRSLDRQTPPIDFDGIKNQLAAAIAQKQPAPTPEPVAPPSPYTIPPGLLGDIARFIHAAAPRPVPEIALAAAIGLMAGICGRSYNVSGTGLNQYMLLLGTTGVGKEAIAKKTGQLMAAVHKSVSGAIDFIGPGEIASSRALIKHFAGSKTSSFVSILGEFGIFLSQMNARNPDNNMKGLRRIFLDLFNKSGHGDMLRPTIYSDKAQNVPEIKAPALTLLCESTPEEFYKALDESMISQGLIPRFFIIEYYGKRPALNENHASVVPEIGLIANLATLCSQSLLLNGADKVIDAQLTPEADELCKEFDKFCDAKINDSPKEVYRHIWNRGHLKAMKLAALVAVGINPYYPVIDPCAVNWAINMIKADAHNLVKRFEDGCLCQADTVEGNHIKFIKKWIKKFINTQNDKIKDARNKAYHFEKILPYKYLQNNLHKTMKPIELSNGIKALLDTGELIEADNKIRERIKTRYAFECFKTKLYIVDASIFEGEENE